MLQVDEIIQQKEWLQLNTDEKALLSELADNEDDYNLLKNMLVVSSETVAEVPALSNDVYQHIKAALPVTTKRTIGRYWYAAAAAIAVLVIAVLFILKKDDERVFVKNPGTPVETKPMLQEPLAIITDSTPVFVDKAGPQKTKKLPANKKQIYPSLQNDNPKDYVAINTSVSMNASFLDLITEVE